MLCDCKVNELNTELTGRRIKTLMEEKNIPIKELSEIMNISFQAVYRWQRGETLPTIYNFYILSQILGMPVDDMLVGSEKG